LPSVSRAFFVPIKKIPQQKPGLGARLHISPGLIWLAAVIIFVTTSFFLVQLGPVQAHKDWARVSAYAEDDAADVVQHGLQAYMSRIGAYNPRRAGAPKVTDFGFISPPLFISMPEWVGFAGRSSAGFYHGRYYTHTGEVEADVMMRAHTLHITGRVANHIVVAEIDGTPAELVYPPESDGDDEHDGLPMNHGVTLLKKRLGQ